MFDKIFVSPQVKRIVIINNKHGIYELPQELLYNLRLGIFAAGGQMPTQEKKRLKTLGNKEILYLKTAWCPALPQKLKFCQY